MVERCAYRMPAVKFSLVKQTFASTIICICSLLRKASMVLSSLVSKLLLAEFANSVSICFYSSFFESALIDHSEPVRKDLHAHIIFASIVDILIYISSCAIQW